MTTTRTVTISVDDTPLREALDRAAALLERLRVLTPEPGDLIIGTIPQRMDAQDADHAYKVLRAAFPDQNVILIPADMDIAAYRPQPTPQPESTTP